MSAGHTAKVILVGFAALLDGVGAAIPDPTSKIVLLAGAKLLNAIAGQVDAHVDPAEIEARMRALIATIPGRVGGAAGDAQEEEAIRAAPSAPATS